MRWTRARQVNCGLAAAMLASVAAVAFTVAAPAGAATVKVPAKYASGITVAMDASYPPDEFMKGGKIVGFDADLAAALGKVMGVKMKLEDATFATIITGIEDGKYDLGDSSFTDNTTREKQVTFVDYFKAGEGYYEKADSKASFNGLKALCGHSVAVEDGTTEQTDANNEKKVCKVTVLPYEDQNGVNLAVSTGRADIGFADSQVAAYIVHLSKGQFKLTGTPFETAPYGMAVAKDSGLAQPLLSAFKVIMANGQYKKILKKWGVEQGALSAPGINEAGR
jgi:polar amino acid transport system substrate-binding protein